MFSKNNPYGSSVLPIPEIRTDAPYFLLKKNHIYNKKNMASGGLQCLLNMNQPEMIFLLEFLFFLIQCKGLLIQTEA